MISIEDGTIWVSQSDISSWRMCPESLRSQLDGEAPRGVNDKTLFGSAVHLFIEEMLCGTEEADAAGKAVEEYQRLRKEAIEGGGWLDTHSFGPELEAQRCLGSPTDSGYASQFKVSDFTDAIIGYGRSVLAMLDEVNADLILESPMSVTIEGYRTPNMGLKVGLQGTADVVAPAIRHVFDPKTGRKQYTERDAWVEHRYNPQPRMYTLLASYNSRGLASMPRILAEDPDYEGDQWGFTWLVARYGEGHAVTAKNVTMGTHQALIEEVLGIANLFDAWDGRDDISFPKIYLPNNWHCSKKWCSNFSNCAVVQGITDEYGDK